MGQVTVPILEIEERTVDDLNDRFDALTRI